MSHQKWKYPKIASMCLTRNSDIRLRRTGNIHSRFPRARWKNLTWFIAISRTRTDRVSVTADPPTSNIAFVPVKQLPLSPNDIKYRLKAFLRQTASTQRKD